MDMTEAASHLDLEVLSETRDLTTLRPREKKKSLHVRPTSRWFFLFLILVELALLTRWLVTALANLYLPALVFVTVLFYLQRERVRGVYKIHDTGLRIPYTWFSFRTIPYENIIRISDDTVSEEETGEEYSAIRIVLDTPLIKFNVSGMQPPNILLTTQQFDSHDLNSFADELVRKNNEDPATPNTLAQRVTDLVNRAWKYRWQVIFLNVFDATTEFLLYLFVIEGFLLGIFYYGIWPALGLVLFGLYSLSVLIVQVLNKPQAIVAIRPHDLGPLLYDEEEILTTVRFIVMCRPYTVHLLQCDMIYEEGRTKQVGQMTQIHPKYIDPGELTYGVAQIRGNHTKAQGAKIQFTYKEKEDKTEVIYQIPIRW